jgi:thiosulfate reductase cytochrome b subunit
MNFEFGKMLIIFGVVLILVGLLLSFRSHIPWLGKLPGDIYIKRDGFHFYFPIMTSILLSILLSIILSLFRRS